MTKTNHSPTNFRQTPDERERMEALAERLDLSITEIIRTALNLLYFAYLPPKKRGDR